MRDTTKAVLGFLFVALVLVAPRVLFEITRGPSADDPHRHLRGMQAAFEEQTKLVAELLHDASKHLPELQVNAYATRAYANGVAHEQSASWLAKAVRQ